MEQTMENRDAYSRKTHLIGGLILLLGSLLRLIGLGSAALSQNEAVLALQARDLFVNEGVNTGQLLYTLPTAILFRCFGSSEFTARLFPAFSGFCLILIPLLMKRRLGERRSLIFALILALEPTLVFWSRQADGLICVITLIIAGMAAFSLGNDLPGMSFFALALCGGVRFWPVFLAAVLSYGFRFVASRAFPYSGFSVGIRFPASKSWMTAAGALVLLSTAFLTFPRGLGMIGSGLTACFTETFDWQQPGLVAMIIAVLLYCGGPILFSLLRFRTTSDTLRMDMIFSAVFALFLLLFWQGVLSLPWLAVSAWYYGADMLTDVSSVFKQKKSPAFLISAAVIPAVFAFLYFRISELVRMDSLSAPLALSINGTSHLMPVTRMTGYAIIMAIGIVIFLLILRILTGYFESPEIYAGLIAGLLILFAIGEMTDLMAAAGFGRHHDSPVEWRYGGENELLGGSATRLTDGTIFEMIRAVSLKDSGTEAQTSGVVLLDEPLYDWQLRNMPKITRTLPAQFGETAFIVDSAGANYGDAGFFGTVYPTKARVDWKTLAVRDWLQWLIYRNADAAPVAVSFWVPFQLMTGE